VIPRFTELQILQAIRESLSSEHSARMVAMRNASESAESLSDVLQLDFNKGAPTGHYKRDSGHNRRVEALNRAKNKGDWTQHGDKSQTGN